MKINRVISWLILPTLVLMLGFSQTSFAQETPPMPPVAATPQTQPQPLLQPDAASADNALAPTDAALLPADAARPVDTAAVAPGEINPSDMQSLVFTYWEHTAIKDAKNSRGLVRPPSEAELMRDLKQPGKEKIKPPPEERDITLGGIVYVTPEEWAIWLNGKRVTPKALPEEVIDLKVYKEYIEVKWFDDYTNQIFPLRMRAHQRFNIDTRIFLPG